MSNLEPNKRAKRNSMKLKMKKIKTIKQRNNQLIHSRTSLMSDRYIDHFGKL